MSGETITGPGQQQAETLRSVPAGRPLLLQYHWQWRNEGPDQTAVQNARQAIAGHGVRLFSAAPVRALAIGASDRGWSEIWLAEFGSAADVEAHLELPAMRELMACAREVEIVVASAPSRRMRRIIGLLNRFLPWLPAPRHGDHLPEELLLGGINPTPEQLAFFREADERRPIHMFNLLKFHARARYAEGDRGMSGQGAYENGYGRVAMSCFLRLGGRIVTLGRYRFTLVGNDGQAAPGKWDEIAVIEYPNRQAFVHMISNPGYQAALAHRDAGLARTQVWCAEPPAEYCR